MPKDKSPAKVGAADKVFSRIEVIQNLSFLERYGFLMSKFQLLEWKLKRLLADERGFSFEEVNEWTALGQRFIDILKQEGMHPTFIELLSEIKVYRNHFAHAFLIDTLLSKTILGDSNEKNTAPQRLLDKAIFSTEQFLLIAEEMPPGGLWTKCPIRDHWRNKAG